jgi:Lrp/AsnC family transcriptional regulator for asnA, asnC and gidA
MDGTDEDLIQVVDSGTIKYTDIARKLKLPLSTVHFRLKKLEREKVILHYRAEIDWKKAGFPIAAYIFVNIDVDLLKKIDKSQDDLLKEFMSIFYVRDGALITGDADILLKIIAKSSEHLKDILLNAIDSREGVVRTKTMLVLG